MNSASDGLPALYVVASGICPGSWHMRIDDLLLSQLCQLETPVLIARTYLWKHPTLTLGVHQPDSDLPVLLARYQDKLQAASEDMSASVVRRPTGGRAILHDQDISFSFLTNWSGLTRLSLKESYRMLTRLVTDTLTQLEIPLQQAEENSAYQAEGVSPNQYVHSAVCFETKTPSDLLTESGQKIAGSAQLRRAGGLLQQGTSFLASFQQGYDRALQYERFHRALVTVLEDQFTAQVKSLSNDALSDFFAPALVPG